MDKNIIGKMLYIDGKAYRQCAEWTIDYGRGEVYFLFDSSDITDVDCDKILSIGDPMLTAGAISSLGNVKNKRFVGVDLYEFVNSALYDFVQLADVIEGEA